jgi:hypothetical protein
MTTRGLSVIERLEMSSMPVTECGCWIWMKACISNGYGNIVINKKSWLAHRASWTAHHGPIPDGASVLHRCDIRPCINPDHLFLGDHKSNSDDMFAKGRESKRDGINNGRAKLTPEEVTFIRSTPTYTRGLAERFQVTRSAICRARRGSSWSKTLNSTSHNQDQMK